MDRIRVFFNTVIECGVCPGLTPEAIQQIRMVNRLIIIGWVVCFSFTLFYLFQGFYLLLPVVGVFFVTSLIVLSLQANGRRNAAAAMTTSVGTLVIFAAGALMKGEQNVEVILFSITMAPFILIPREAKALTAGVVGLNILSVFVYSFLQLSEVGVYGLSDSQAILQRSMILLSSFALLILQIKYFITESDKAKAVVRLQHQEVVAKTRMSELGLMAGGVAHEINNPLAVVAGSCRQMSRLLSMEPIQKDKFAERIEIIRSNCDRMRLIVKGLLTLSRDGAKDDFVVENVADILEDVEGLIRHKLKTNEFEFEVQIPNENCYVKCRRVQIGQIVLNLVGNAYDVLENQENKMIKISVENHPGGMVCIQVTDNGPGVPSELKNDIMKAFFTTKQLGKGTGMGLSIAKEIARDHLGDLYLDESKEMTTFVLSLPAATIRKKQDRVA